MLYLRADFLVRVKQHSELWCNRRASERRAELARAIPSEEEEGEANRRQAESNVKLALNIAEARRRKTKSNLTKKDAEERVKDHKG